MEPSGDRRQEARRSTDAEIADLSRAYSDLAEDVREVKHLLETNYVPRIQDLETWRTQWAATELEREKNRTRQQQNAIGRRELWFAVLTIVITMLGTVATLVGVVLTNT